MVVVVAGVLLLTVHHMFQDKKKKKNQILQLELYKAVPTFKDGGPLLMAHLFKLPSEVPGWEWIQR